jgi:hypothetical protein
MSAILARVRPGDGLAFARVQDVHHQTNDGARSVELACLLVRGVRKLLDEVFVRLAEDVCLPSLISE